MSLPYLVVTEEGNFLKSAGHLILRASKGFGAKTRYSTPTEVVKKGEGHNVLVIIRLFVNQIIKNSQKIAP